MHPQAQWAKEKLIKAGFRWREVRVRTIRYTTKADRAAHGDYGNAVISFQHCPLERQMALIPAMQAQGLDVLAFTKDGKIALVCVFDRHKAQGDYTEKPL